MGLSPSSAHAAGFAGSGGTLVGPLTVDDHAGGSGTTALTVTAPSGGTTHNAVSATGTFQVDNSAATEGGTFAVNTGTDANHASGSAFLAQGPSGADVRDLPSIKLTDPSSPGEAVFAYGRQTYIFSSFSPGAGSSVFKVVHGGGMSGDLVLIGTTRFLDTGTLVINQHSAPADASLNAGDCALWFDQTNGASKLMVKAKQADGTVKTASVALA